MTRFVAEIGSNHNGSYERAAQLVETAAAVGCQAVKAQFFSAARLYADPAQRAAARDREVPADWLPALAQQARSLGLAFGCSVFDVGGAEYAAEHCDFLKVSSYSMLDTRLLRAVDGLARPTVLSTGMATLDELEEAVFLLRHVPLEVLHCISLYPASVGQCHLSFMKTLAHMTDARVGWSDHTAQMAPVLSAALHFNASSIEVHLDLDGVGAEFSGGHCWLPLHLHSVVMTVRAAESCASLMSSNERPDAEERVWRSDPSDGLRPMKEAR